MLKTAPEAEDEDQWKRTLPPLGYVLTVSPDTGSGRKTSGTPSGSVVECSPIVLSFTKVSVLRACGERGSTEKPEVTRKHAYKKIELVINSLHDMCSLIKTSIFHCK